MFYFVYKLDVLAHGAQSDMAVRCPAPCTIDQFVDTIGTKPISNTGLGVNPAIEDAVDKLKAAGVSGNIKPDVLFEDWNEGSTNFQKILNALQTKFVNARQALHGREVPGVDEIISKISAATDGMLAGRQTDIAPYMIKTLQKVGPSKGIKKVITKVVTKGRFQFTEIDVAQTLQQNNLRSRDVDWALDYIGRFQTGDAFGDTSSLAAKDARAHKIHYNAIVRGRQFKNMVNRVPC
ncbi:hypothetical protein NQ176_g2790 [Zarea fungicola]|uniref:Uncharacterized protein n=1 Tax=Zarea fungicola TaxID=93591 RepID=A0ACC1NNL1_9HYPO|nr:hypothetical protein NQ176_g2790 [Lecanicillium fungicola]